MILSGGITIVEFEYGKFRKEIKFLFNGENRYVNGIIIIDIEKDHIYFDYDDFLKNGNETYYEKYKEAIEVNIKGYIENDKIFLKEVKSIKNCLKEAKKHENSNYDIKRYEDKNSNFGNLKAIMFENKPSYSIKHFYGLENRFNVTETLTKNKHNVIIIRIISKFQNNIFYENTMNNKKLKLKFILDRIEV